MRNKTALTAFFYIISLLGLILIATGFFSIKNVLVDLSSIEHNNLDGLSVNHDMKEFGRLVVVVIDALRADMVFGDKELGFNVGYHLNKNMAYTASLLASGKALGYVSYANTPTVTMPRLKALTTGKIPAFVDLFKNFNTQEILDDNLISRFNAAGLKGVFYGDDTWLKLFPSSFVRSEGTSGFFTKDTVQVDNNITRHLKQELDPFMKNSYSKDWDYLILHYLGLDHVGHLRGPNSSLMQSKLLEMDDIIQRIHKAIIAQDKILSPKLPTLLVVCSDHGMTDMGNHGGASAEETSSVLLLITEKIVIINEIENEEDFTSSSSSPSSSIVNRIMQVDLVPTLALLFGVHIPVFNTGVLISNIWKRLKKNKVQEYYKGIMDNYNQLINLMNANNLNISSSYEASAFSSLYSAELSSFSKASIQDMDKSVKNILKFMKFIQKKLSDSNDQYNVYYILLGIVLLFIISFSCRYFIPEASSDWKTLSGFIVHLISLTSTSSIENEHATWFFLSTSIFLLLLLSEKNIKQKGYLVLILLCLRLLRNRNQVINFGRMNGLEPSKDDTISVLSTEALLPGDAGFYIFFSWILVGGKLLFSRGLSSKNFYQIPILLLLESYAFYVILKLKSPLLSHQENSDATTQLAWIVYVICFVILVVSLFSSCWKMACTCMELAFWLLLFLLSSLSNVPTLSLLIFQSILLRTFIENTIDEKTKRKEFISIEHFLSLSILCGQTAFYSLGNSHVIATIDFNGAYTGLEAYHQIFVGCLTFVIVFSGPILFLFPPFYLLSFLHQKTQQDFHLVFFKGYLFYSFIFLLQCAVYSLVSYLMRYHLFVWSVFIPKLLYQLAITFLIITLTFITTMLTMLFTGINCYRIATFDFRQTTAL